MENYLEKLEKLHRYSEDYVQLQNDLRLGEGVFDEDGNYKDQDIFDMVTNDLKRLCADVGIHYYHLIDNLQEIEL